MDGHWFGKIKQLVGFISGGTKLPELRHRTVQVASKILMYIEHPLKYLMNPYNIAEFSSELLPLFVFCVSILTDDCRYLQVSSLLRIADLA